MNNINGKQTTLDLPWYEAKSESAKFLPKYEGINYYLVLEIPMCKETTTKDDRKFKTVNIKAKYLKTTGLGGGLEHDLSPKTPYEGVLSVSFAVSESLVKYMETQSIPIDSIIGNVIKLVRIGKELETKYPQVELLSMEFY